MTSKQVTVAIMDRELAASFSSYPSYDSDRSFVAYAKAFFAMARRQPVFKDFKTTSGEPKIMCFGPIGLRQSKHPAEHAIARFIKEQLGFETEQTNAILTSTEDPLALRSVHYITFADQDAVFDELVHHFHIHESALYLDQFSVCGIPMKPDPAICVGHNVPRSELGNNYKVQLIQEHIKGCLHKDVGGEKKPEEKMVWAQMTLPPKPSDMPIDVWASAHPLFRYFTYDKASRTVLLKEADKQRLAPELRQIYVYAESGKNVSPRQEALLTQLLHDQYNKYKEYGLVLDGFAYGPQWSLTEKLACLARPPQTRKAEPMQPAIYGKHFPQFQDYGFIMSHSMKLITNVAPKGSKSSSSTQETKDEMDDVVIKGSKGRGAKSKTKGAGKLTKSKVPEITLLVVPVNKYTEAVTKEMKTARSGQFKGEPYIYVHAVDIDAALNWLCTQTAFPRSSIVESYTPAYEPEVVASLVPAQKEDVVKGFGTMTE